ncbi:MAG: ferritin-like domain-containing protein [Halanaerobiales bacterium]
MKDRFNAVEVIEMAKDIEKRGHKFYTNQAELAGDQELKDLFTKLAEDELDHYERFEELAKVIKDVNKEHLEYVYDPEVSAYLEAIVEFAIFPAEEGVEIRDIVDALQIAIYAEKDSILFYSEMLKYNDDQTAVVLKKLIEEEKQHLLDLVRYDAELSRKK